MRCFSGKLDVLLGPIGVCLDPCAILTIDDHRVFENDVAHIIIALSTDTSDA